MLDASITTTYNGAYLQNVTYLGLPFELKENTTLNQKLGIIPDLDIPQGVYPKPRYIAIGNGGHQLVNGVVPKISNVPHRASDSVLYNQLPFVLRDLNDDLDAALRDRFALRKIINVGGQDKIAYYLLRLDMANVAPIMNRITTVNGTSSTVEFIPSNENMNPTPPVVVADGTNDTNSIQIVVKSIAPFLFDAVLREEFMNAIRVLYEGDEDLSVISEIALCSAIDKQHTGQIDNGNTITYNEVQACQVNYFINTFKSLVHSSQGFQMQLDIGKSDPMYIEE